MVAFFTKMALGSFRINVGPPAPIRTPTELDLPIAQSVGITEASAGT